MPRQSTQYIVKRSEPFPGTDLYLDSNGMGGSYMGKAASRNPTGNHPSYPFKVLIKARARGEYDDDENGKPAGKEIGYIRGWVLRCASENENFLTMIDGLAGELTDGVRHMTHTLCADNGYWLEDGYDEIADLLFIQQIYLQPEYRGYGVSLLALHHLMTLPGYSVIRVLIGSRPFAPADFAGSTDPLAVELTPERKEAALESLGKHWELLGFELRHDEEDVEYWSRSMEVSGPYIHKIVPHLMQGSQ